MTQKISTAWYSYSITPMHSEYVAARIANGGFNLKAISEGEPFYTSASEVAMRDIPSIVEFLYLNNFKLLSFYTVKSNESNASVVYYNKSSIVSFEAYATFFCEIEDIQFLSSDRKETKIDLCCVSSDKDFMLRFNNLTTSLPARKEVSNIKIITQSAPDKPYSFRSFKRVYAPLVSNNYSDLVMSQYKSTIKNLYSKIPNGRITIFNGPPGTGKTYLMRAIMTELNDCNFILVPDKIVPKLSDPDFVEALTNITNKEGYGATNHAIVDKKPNVLIIEDADAILRKRSGGNMNGLSSALNLGDGIYGESIDIRIICSTNMKEEEFDEAAIRKGRLNQLINVKALDKEKAISVFNDLAPGKEVPEKILSCKNIVLADIYSLVKDEEEE